MGADADDIERDALIMLGRVAFESNGLGTLGTGADFNGYLRGLLVLASESSLPNIATQISEYTATILHSHPSSDARFDFILDILKDCPAPECNEAAILWLKDEICVAFNPRPSFPQGAIKKHDSSVSEEASNVFTHAATLRSTAPFIFAKPNLGKSNDIAPHTQAKFWLAALNLYYLLCASEILYEALEVHTLCKDFNIESDFVRPLETLVRRQFTDASQGETEDMYQSFIPLMDDALLRLKCLREQKSST